MEVETTDASVNSQAQILTVTKDTKVVSHSPIPENATAVNDEELEKFWKVVQENPSDFTGWTYLLAYVQKERNLSEARKAFKQFLTKYPYCYGYWNRWAELEKSFENSANASKVYEDAISSYPLCIDIWMPLINFESAKLKKLTLGVNEDSIRRLYNRALENAGLDWKSGILWESCIKWEETRNPAYALEMYDKLFSTPINDLSKFMESFENFVKSYNPKNILSTEEFLEHHKVIAAEKADNVMKQLASNESDPTEEDEPEDTEKSEVAPPGDETDGVAVESTDDLNKMRSLIIKKRKKVVELTNREIEKRKPFELRIRRPYFHVQPLERGQLKNWKEYLDIEITEGSEQRVVFLFERCLVACALYEEFWLKYVNYLMSKNMVDQSRSVFMRACQIHLPKRPYIHLAWAAFEETRGCFSKSFEILNSIETRLPGLAMTRMRQINLHRRRGELEAAAQTYQDSINETCTPNAAIFYTCKYARFLYKVKQDTKAAVNLLNDAIVAQPFCSKLHLLLIEILFHSGNIVESEEERETIVKALSNAVVCVTSIEEKIVFSQRKMEFLEDFGSDVDKLLKAYDEHQILLKEGSLSRKRKQQEHDNVDAMLNGEAAKTSRVTNGVS